MRVNTRYSNRKARFHKGSLSQPADLPLAPEDLCSRCEGHTQALLSAVVGETKGVHWLALYITMSFHPLLGFGGHPLNILHHFSSCKERPES